MANNKPTETLKDGLLKATIWKNEGDKGSFYRVNLTRSYQDNAEKWHDTDSFSGSELLRIAHLAQKAYDRTTELRQQDRKAAEAEATPDDGRRS